MRKILFVVIILFALTACGKNDNDEKLSDKNNATSQVPETG